MLRCYLVRQERDKQLTVAEYITQIITEQGRQKTWLADNLGITKQVLNYKFASNSFTAEELINIGKLLSIDLNKLKE